MSAKNIKSSAQTLACFSSFAISTAHGLLEASNSEKMSDVTDDHLQSIYNHFAPFNHSDKKPQDIEENFEDPWWNWCTVFAVCSVLSVILIFSLCAIITKCFIAIKEKEVMKFSSPKTRDGWYSDNLLETEQRNTRKCSVTEKDFIVVW